MEDYAKMYAVLCGAIDDVIDGLEALPGAAEYAQHLKSALLQAEEIYCDGETASHPEAMSTAVKAAGRCPHCHLQVDINR